MGDLRVCVIGAGAAGLTTIKQLKDVGISSIECFEKDDDIGGIFHYGKDKNGVYDNAVLTISNYLMAFSDMPPTGHRYHWHHTEYQAYLREYAARFDLLRHITLRTSVLILEGGPGAWHVVVQNAAGETIDKGLYDAVAVCSGAHQAVNWPNIPGLASFPGTIIHSSAYKNNEPFRGKDCVCVGMGESGADVVREISDVASSTVLALRSFPYLIPRLARPFHQNPLGCSSDAFTSHLRHDWLLVPMSHYRRLKHFVNRLVTSIAAFLFILFPFLGRGTQPCKKDAFNQDASIRYIDKDTLLSPMSAKLILSFNDLSGQQERGQKFACKNVTFVDNIVQGKIATNASGIKLVDGNTIHFQDGSRCKCDTMVLCTGYRDEFKFLKGTLAGVAGSPPLAVPEGNVRRLFKHVFHPDIGKTMAWIGFVRPSTGGIPVCAEMAARYFALLLAGQRELPKDIVVRIMKDYELDTRVFCLSPDVKTLVGYKDWMDSMAELVGCEVRLWRYLLQPTLLVHLGIGSLLPSQYRLAGPCASPELAKATILSVPVAVTRRQSATEAYKVWLRYLNPRYLFSGEDIARARQ